MYAECLQQRSSTELYGAAPTSAAADVVTAVGPHALIEVTRTHLGGGRPVEALDSRIWSSLRLPATQVHGLPHALRTKACP
jgi:hypothetical protein